MAIPKVYRWDDANAPVLNGLSGTLVNLLKKCLVDGYDIATPAGWTLEFEDQTTNKAVFRPNPSSGNGHFLLVSDNANANATATGYELMTAIDTGTGKFPATDQYWVKSGANTSATRRWLCAATDTFFYLCVYHQTASNEEPVGRLDGTTNRAALSLMFFGDLAQTAVDDNFATIIGIGRNNLNTGTYAGSVYGLTVLEAAIGAAGNAELVCCRDKTALSSAKTMTYIHPGGPSVRTRKGQGYHIHEGPEFNGGLNISKVLLADGSTYALRGALPGLFVPGHSCLAFPNGLSEITVDTRRFIQLPAFGVQTPTAYVNVRSFLLEVGVDW